MHRRFGYYLGAHGGKILLWHAYDLFFAYFLTLGLALPPRTMGVATMALMVFGAVADSVAGVLIGRGPDAARRLARLQLYGALASVAAFPLLFSTPAALPPLAHALCVGLLFQVCYKLYDVPQNALTSVLSRDNVEVLQLSTGRYLLSGAARTAVAFAMYLLVDHAAIAGWRIAVFVAALCVPALVSAQLLDRVLRSSPEAGSAFQPAAPGSLREWRARLPVQMPVLLSVALLHAATVPVMGRTLAYLGERSYALVAFSAGTMLLLPLFKRVASRSGEHVAFAWAALLVMASCAGLAWSCRWDGHEWLLDGLAVLYGGGAFAGTMLLWGAAANMIHCHDAYTGRRSDVLSYGIFSFASKLGIALSMLALGYVLEPAAGIARSAGMLDGAATLAAIGAAISALAMHRTMRGLSVAGRRDSGVGAEPLSGTSG